MARWQDKYFNSADGVRLHYRDYAGPHDKPPILCLHGLTRNARDFEAVAARYAGDWRVIALDFRGRGGSAADPDPSRYNPKSYAADVLKLLDQLGIADAVFVGTSLGGIVTMVVAAQFEERVAGALLNDVGPELAPEGIARILDYVGQPVRYADWSEAAAALMARSGNVHPTLDLAGWEVFARRTMREAKDGGIVYDYDMAIAEPFKSALAGQAADPWPLLDALKGRPVTILRGALTDLLTAEAAQKMVARLGQDAVLVEVPDVGHAPTYDEPAAIAALDDLLARVAART